MVGDRQRITVRVVVVVGPPASFGSKNLADWQGMNTNVSFVLCKRNVGYDGVVPDPVARKRDNRQRDKSFN